MIPFSRSEAATPKGDAPRGRPRLVLLTCVHKRPELTRAVLGIYRQMQRSVAEEVDLRLLAVGSEGLRSRKMCEDHGFDYIEHANSPLSHKWNAGVDAARDYDPDGLVIVGSDDLVSKEMFRAYADRLSDGVDFFGLEDLYFFDAATGLLGYWSGYGSLYPARKGEPIGCGRCFSRRLLDSTFWNLWPMGQGFESGLDEVTLALLQGRGFAPRSWKMTELGIRAVDIKVGPNITPISSYTFERSWNGSQAMDFLGEWLSQEELDGLLRAAGRVTAP